MRYAIILCISAETDRLCTYIESYRPLEFPRTKFNGKSIQKKEKPILIEVRCQWPSLVASDN